MMSSLNRVYTAKSSAVTRQVGPGTKATGEELLTREAREAEPDAYLRNQEMQY